MNDKTTLMADYTSGAENAASIGVAYQVSDNLGIQVGWIMPNERHADDTISILLSFSGNYRKPAPGDK